MPLPTGHALAGLMSAYYFKKDRLRPSEAILCVLVANLPDFDYIPGIWVGSLKRFHPSFTHSICAATLFFLMVYWLSERLKIQDPLRWTWVLGITYTTHIFLDSIQVDTYPINGIGIPLFFPFTNQCYHTGWDLLNSGSNFIDFNSTISAFRSILKPELLRSLLLEQLAIGTIIGVIFGMRRIWNQKNIRLVKQKEY